MNSILVIRLTSLGDVILATPIVRALHTAYPNANIDVAVDAAYEEVWRNNPCVGNVHSVQKGQEHKVDLPTYDLVVDLQRNRRSGRLLRNVCTHGKPYVVRYSKHRLEKLALVYLKRKPDAVTHVVDRYANSLGALGLEGKSYGMELWTVKGRASHGVQQADSGKFRVGVAPGAQHYTKRYPVDQMAQLIRTLVQDCNVEVVTVGGKADTSICDDIVTLARVPVTRADGAVSLASTLDVLTGLDVLVSCDSAAVHMASACMVPVVVIYGSTVPEFGFTPYHVPHAIVQSTSLACRPCTHIGRAQCPKGHFRCMTEISTNAVVEQIMQVCARLTRS